MSIRMQMSGLKYRYWDGIIGTVVEVSYRGQCMQYTIPFSKIVWC